MDTFHISKTQSIGIITIPRINLSKDILPRIDYSNNLGSNRQKLDGNSNHLKTEINNENNKDC